MYSVGNAEAADRCYNHFTLFGVCLRAARSSSSSERIRMTISFTRCPLWFIPGRMEECRAGPRPHRASRCPVRVSGHRSSAPALREASCSARHGTERLSAAPPVLRREGTGREAALITAHGAVAAASGRPRAGAEVPSGFPDGSRTLCGSRCPDTVRRRRFAPTHRH